jgi:hypothetical protein
MARIATRSFETLRCELNCNTAYLSALNMEARVDLTTSREEKFFHASLMLPYFHKTSNPFFWALSLL